MSDKKVKVLCIDDDPDIRDAIKMILEAKGYDVAEADSAEEGIKAYKNDTPDIIFCDMMMEEVDSGLNFMKELKNMQSAVPVILLSAVGDSYCSVADCHTQGFSGVLQKPFNEKQLLGIIESKLNK